MTSTSPNGNGTRPAPAASPGRMPSALELLRRAEEDGTELTKEDFVLIGEAVRVTLQEGADG